MGRCLAMTLSFLVLMAETAFSGGSSPQIPPRSENKQAFRENVKKAPEGRKDLDKNVAAELEILKMMEMLEHIDLYNDMDVLDGGGKQQ